MLFEKFQDGCHLGYQNGTIIAILNLCVTVMPPFKFQLDLTSGLEGDVVRRISRWPPWRPFRLLEWNNFSNSDLDVATMPPKFSPIGLPIWEEMLFEEFQDGHHDSHLGYWKGTILAILNLYVATMSPTKFQLNPTYSSRGDVENVKS